MDREVPSPAIPALTSTRRLLLDTAPVLSRALVFARKEVSLWEREQ